MVKPREEKRVSISIDSIDISTVEMTDSQCIYLKRTKNNHILIHFLIQS